MLLSGAFLFPIQGLAAKRCQNLLLESLSKAPRRLFEEPWVQALSSDSKSRFFEVVDVYKETYGQEPRIKRKNVTKYSLTVQKVITELKQLSINPARSRSRALPLPGNEHAQLVIVLKDGTEVTSDICTSDSMTHVSMELTDAAFENSIADIPVESIARVQLFHTHTGEFEQSILLSRGDVLGIRQFQNKMERQLGIHATFEVIAIPLYSPSKNVVTSLESKSKN